MTRYEETYLVVTAEDCRQGAYSHPNNCPVNLAMRRILRPGLTPIIGPWDYDIEDESGKLLAQCEALPSHIKQVRQGDTFLLPIIIRRDFLNEQTQERLAAKRQATKDQHALET